MNVLSINADYVSFSMPTPLFRAMGWKENTDFEIIPQSDGVIFKPKTESKLSEQDKLLLSEIAGIITLTKEQSDELEKQGSLFDFRVEDHITLFDESDD